MFEKIKRMLEQHQNKQILKKYKAIAENTLEYYKAKEKNGGINIPAFKRAETALKTAIKSKSDILNAYNKMKKCKVA